MDKEIAIALITTLVTAMTSLIGILISNKLSNYRIKKLEEKVDKHNSLIERMYKVEDDVCDLKKEVKEIKEVGFRLIPRNQKS